MEHSESTKYRASIVIPFYGDPTDTLNLIEQLKAQTITDGIEIIVSDDCSPTPFPRTENVKVVRRKDNGGFGANVNSGVSVAQGEWLFILNSDLTIPGDFVERMLDRVKLLGNIVASPQIIDEHGNHQWVARKFPTVFQFAWEWFTPVARLRNTRVWHLLVGHDLRSQTGQTFSTDWVVGACMVLRRDSFQQIGGMEESFFMNSEEVDLQKRLTEQGIPSYFVGDLEICHIGGASSGDYYQRRRWVTQSRIKYMKKWGSRLDVKRTLTCVSYLNYSFNSLRSLRNNNIDSKKILCEELSYLEN